MAISLISGLIYGFLVWFGGFDEKSWADDVADIGHAGVFFVIIVVFLFFGLFFSILVGLIGVISRFLVGEPASKS